MTCEYIFTAEISSGDSSENATLKFDADLTKHARRTQWLYRIQLILYYETGINNFFQGTFLRYFL